MLELDRALADPVHRRAGLRLPSAAGLRLQGGLAVYVGDEFAEFEGRAFAIRDGRAQGLDEALVQAAMRIVDRHEPGEDFTKEPLLIAAEPDTPYETLTAILEAGRAAGYVNGGLVVDGDSASLRYLRLELLERVYGQFNTNSETIAGPDTAPVLTIDLGEAGMTVSRARHSATEPERLAPADLAGLRAYAEATQRADPDAHLVVLSATPTTPYQAVFDALLAVTGPEYPFGDALLKEVILVEGSARTYAMTVEPTPPVDAP